MPRLLASSHALRKDLLDDPGQGNHADYIGSSHSADFATEDGLESIRDHVQSRRRGDFGIPMGKVVVAILLRLRYMEDLILAERYEMRLSPAFILGEDVRDMAPGRYRLLLVTTRTMAGRAGCSCGQGKPPWLCCGILGRGTSNVSEVSEHLEKI